MTAIIDEKHNQISCPHCDGKLKIPIARPVATAHIDSFPNSEFEALTGKVEELSKKITAPKIEKQIEYPSFMPGEYCADGNCALGGVHRNKNYKRKPAKACKNCSQIAPKNAPRCAWCNNKEFEDLDEDNLKDLGIKLPMHDDDEDHEGHNHDE